MLLEELSQKKTLNVDFHNHGQTGSDFRKEQIGFVNKLWGLFMTEGFSGLASVLDRVRNTKLDILYITNFSDLRYESWTSKEQIENARKEGYQIEQGMYYTFSKKDGRVIVLGKSQEVPTKQGHILFSGLRTGKRISEGKDLEETLKEANDGELRIADHPYCRIKGQRGILSDSKNEEEYVKKVDCLERNGNFYLPVSIANWRVLKNSGKYNVPILADSDGHHPRDIGNTYNLFSSKYIDYSSEKTLRDSISNSAERGEFETVFSPIPPYRIFHHFMMIMLNKIHDKIYNIKR
jgi:hypothetical protein